MKAFVFLMVLIICAPYLMNGYKLSNCDFEPSYRCEAVHGAGLLVPPLAFVTVWFSDDKSGK